MTKDQLGGIREMTSVSVESAAVIVAKLIETTAGNRRLIVQDIIWAPEEAYEDRQHDSMVITPEGYISALGVAQRAKAVAIWLHTHPKGAPPQPSRRDDVVDKALADTFRIRTRSSFYGQMIVSQLDTDLGFTGLLIDKRGKKQSIDFIWSVGQRFELFANFNKGSGPSLSSFDRNVKAYGEDIQSTLGRLHVGVVGCGGTGSAVAEQLVRLGIRSLTLIDDDKIEKSNITRVYGSFPESVGSPKVKALSRHLSHVEPSIQITKARGRITSQPIAKLLNDCDLVFGCTDDNAGRMVLSRMSSVMLVPLIDMGVKLDSLEGVLNGVFGRVTTVTPGTACLLCRDRVDLSAASNELLTRKERKGRIAEGYATELPGIEPAVVTFTTLTAAYATSEFLNRLTGLGQDSFPSELLLFVHNYRVAGNGAAPKSGHYCDPGSKLFASAITEPFLGLAWTD